LIATSPLKLELTSAFTLGNAQSLALASQWAYQKTPDIIGAHRGPGHFL
jgi:hypothetical protein